MFSGARTSGFYRTPVSKGLLILSGSASLLNILLASSATRKILSSNHWLQVIRHAKLLQVLSSTFYFSSAKDILCGSFLIYCFRVFERRYGSKKFSSHIFASTIIAAGLQLVAIYILKNLGHEVGVLPSGPYGMIFACLVQYYFDIPTIDAVTVLGVPISGKILNYSVALQMLVGSRESLLAGACGIVAGVVYKCNAAYVQKWLKLPGFVSNLCSRTLGRLFEDADEPPTQPYPMGATLEIQEQQQMEWHEQQMWRRAAASNAQRQRTRSRAGQGYAEVLVPPGGGGGVGEWLWGLPRNAPPPEWQPLPNEHENNANAQQQQPTVEVSEDQVQTLVEMGFSRQAVLHALTVTNNDVNSATTVLLADAT